MSVTLGDRSDIYVAGVWQRPKTQRRLELISPWTEQPNGSVPNGSARDIDRAVAAAKSARDSWGATEPQERLEILRRMVAALEADADGLAQTVTDEIGAPIRFTRMTSAVTLAVARGTVEALEEFPFEERLGNSLLLRESVGVVGAITPWNYPQHLVLAKLLAVVAAGCTFVLKPSELAPHTAYRIFESLHHAGLPAGVLNMVPGDAATGAALVGHPDVDAVTFTGSTATGALVAQVALQSIKRVSLELGGKSANIILPDADLEKGVAVGVNSCFANAGQTCTALTRTLVHESQLAEAVDIAAERSARFTPGDPSDMSTRLGPVVSAAARKRIQTAIDTAVESGAQLVAGGAEPPADLRQGYFVQPTVLAAVKPTMAVAREEIFGPVLCIIGYRDDLDAVRIANDTSYGLAGAIWSADEERALRVARSVRTGKLDINGARYNAMAPFGGVKQSGMGREHGRFGIEEFTQLKSLQLPSED